MNEIINLVFITLIGFSWCKPQTQRVPLQESIGTPIPIISQSESVGANGSFNFTYETGNGIHVHEGGYLKKNPSRLSDNARKSANGTDDDIQVIVGGFEYKSPDGMEIKLEYTADENGFHPVGDHLPTPPPIPPEILRVLSLLPKTQSDEPHTSH